MRIHPEVAEALAAGRPVVALESTLISHGLPRPRNLAVARELEAAVREQGAVPATVALLGGEACVGLDEEALTLVAERTAIAKCGVRDLAPLAAAGADGATTVSATAHLAARSGIGLFATGGLGGVHRGAAESWDVSADLDTLSRTGIVVVCSGVKSILDVPATLERLETLSVTVLGYGTDRFPGFYLADSGHPLSWRADSPEQVAAVVRARAELGTTDRALVVANPVPLEAQLEPGQHERALRAGLDAAARQGVSGKDVTPFLLERFRSETDGASLEVNIRLAHENATLAARIAAALAATP